MRRAVAVLVGLALVVPAVAQPGGETFQPRGGKFAIKLPGKPKENTITTKSAVGDLKVYTATYATADGNVYMISYTDFPEAAIKPENHDTLLDGVREGIKGKDGKVVSDKEVTIGTEKGREIVVDKGKVQSRFRVVIREHRLYQLALLGTGEFVTGKDATAFLDSFEFVK